MDNEVKSVERYGLLGIRKDNDIIAFIVVKCYVLESFISPDNETTYKVIYPYVNISNFELNQDVKYENPDNLYKMAIVSNLFDNYNEANEYASKKNLEIKRSLISKVLFDDEKWKEKYKKLEKQFYKNLFICKRYEVKILNYMENQDIDKPKKQFVKEIKKCSKN